MAVSMLFPLKKAIMHKGFDFEQFCRYASMDAVILQDVEARIDAEELERLMYAAAEFTGDDHFGLHQGQLTDTADLGILGYVMMHSDDIAAAMKAYQRYNVIVCSGYNVEWELDGEDVLFRFSSTNSIPMSRHCMEDMASSLYHLMQHMSNRTIPMRHISFKHSGPSNLEPYVNVFGVIPRFERENNVMRMSKDILKYPILYSDPRLLRAFESIAGDIKEKLVQGKWFTERVFQWMMKCMPNSFPTLQQTAEQFEMSTRTLQAKLKEEGTSFHDLSANVRKEIAVSYLNRKDYSISEIAYLLHFSEPSAFHNAFKKWTGVAPGQYRANMAQDRVSGETG
ncbi:AraC family transcriptional regulator [Marinicrinis lubricantis]